jgi:hypothetical protein
MAADLQNIGRMLSSVPPFRAAAFIAGIVMMEVRAALRVHGPLGTVARTLGHVGELLTLRRSHRRALSVPDGFDRTHGVHTKIAMDLGELYEIKRRGGEEHAPTPAGMLRDALSALDVRFEETVFVDFGSGAGRAVLLAAEHPFKTIVGVELSASLHRRAEANVASYSNPARRCHDIRLHCGDAAQFTLPADPLVLYFYNPFRDDVMRRVLTNIERSLAAAPRPITILHLWPRRETRTMFAASPFFTKTDDSDVVIFRSRPDGLDGPPRPRGA